MKKRPNILFVHLSKSSFVMEDYKILEGLGSVYPFHFKPSQSIFTLFSFFLNQFFWLIRHIKKADIIYCWFSDYHAFMPALFARLTNKPLFIVNGGFDAVSNKELGYGIYCSTWRAPLGKFVIKNATILLPVDKTLIEADPISINWGEAYPNGIKHHVPNFKTLWQELPTGYDHEAWPAGPAKRSAIVLTVAYINSHRTAMIKGIDLFIECSKLLPNYTFRIIGVVKEMQEELTKIYQPKSNLKMFTPATRGELSASYQEASVYAQLSRSEGLPNVLCEAMLSGCIPVGSTVFGIPSAIGDQRLIAKSPDPKLISELIEKANNNFAKRDKYRKHITENFSLQKRKEKLVVLFNGL